jgi:tight adherence protein B
MMSPFLIIWVVPALCAISLGGIVCFILQAFRAGAEEYAVAYAESAARQMEDMFLFIPSRRILELAMASAAICFLLTFLAVGGFTGGAFLRGVLLGAIIGGAGWHIPYVVLRAMRKRRLQRFNEQLVDSLITMSNALRAGFSIPQAVDLVVKEGRNPIAQEFSTFLHQTRVGMRMEDAFESLRTRVGSEDLSLMIMSIEIARQTGGNLTEVFEKIAHTIRERIRIERRTRTLTAMGRLQGIVMGITPLVLGLIMFVMDPRMMGAFVRSTVGLMILALVAVFEVIGALFIRKIIRIDV